MVKRILLAPRVQQGHLALLGTMGSLGWPVLHRTFLIDLILMAAVAVVVAMAVVAMVE
jgi:hypothetical protein